MPGDITTATSSAAAAAIAPAAAIPRRAFRQSLAMAGQPGARYQRSLLDFVGNPRSWTHPNSTNSRMAAARPHSGLQKQVRARAACCRACTCTCRVISQRQWRPVSGATLARAGGCGGTEYFVPRRPPARNLTEVADPTHPQVLSLYRECLRVARTKAPDMQADIRRIAGQEFREHKTLAKSDIEYARPTPTPQPAFRGCFFPAARPLPVAGGGMRGPSRRCLCSRRQCAARGRASLPVPCDAGRRLVDAGESSTCCAEDRSSSSGSRPPSCPPAAARVPGFVRARR